MTTAQFFEKFDLFAGAPDAVAKMRSLILELAVRGQLTSATSHPSAPSDPSAAALPLNHSPFTRSWRVVLLADVLKNRSGNSKLIKGKLHDTPASHLFQGFSASGADVWCDDFEHEGQAIIVSAVGARCGKAFKAAGKWSAIANTNIVRPDPEHFDFDFAYLVLNNEAFWVRGGSAQPFVKFPPSFDRYFALPTLAEQKRIVAKVDELMALCDQLKAQQQERETKHTALAQATLARFAEAPTPANLNFLFHSSFSIQPSYLRKTILTLAVQGKLVAQDPNDETTAATLSRLGLQSSVDCTLSDASPPSSWSLVRFEDIAQTTGGVTLGRKLANRKTITLPYLRVANVKRGAFDLSIIKEISIAEDELERYSLRKGDLLMTEGGDWDKVGRAALWQGQIPNCLHQNHIFRSRMRSAELSPVWFELYFNSPDGRRYFESAAKQTTNLASINMRQVRNCPIPLPPLAEQKRIVAKVEELIALVDALEAQQAAADQAATHLLDAVVSELAAA